MKSLADFRFHIELHRQRVVLLGLALAQEHYPTLALATVESFLWLHDRSKTLKSHGQLKRYGYEHPELPVQRLFQFYGLSHRTPEQTQELREIVRDINLIDENIAYRFFLRTPNLDRETMIAFYNIEKVADLVDRSLDPIAAEEFGHPMMLASEYIQEPNLARQSLWLEDQYSVITQHLSFPVAPALGRVD